MVFTGGIVETIVVGQEHVGKENLTVIDEKGRGYTGTVVAVTATGAMMRIPSSVWWDDKALTHIVGARVVPEPEAAR